MEPGLETGSFSVYINNYGYVSLLPICKPIGLYVILNGMGMETRLILYDNDGNPFYLIPNKEKLIKQPAYVGLGMILHEWMSNPLPKEEVWSS